MSLEVGALLRGRYEVVRNIKSGGMGSVSEARDVNLANSPCAIKEVIDSAVGGHRGAYIRGTFEKEMKALVDLDHNSIPKVRDFFQDGEKLYIVMEYVSGRSLEEEIAEHKESTGRGLPPGKAVADILALLDIVAYLHRLKPPLIHRDIKPANIIRDQKTGRLKLVDFGLAKAVQQTFTPQTSVGTMGYCAPEQLSGLAEERSDLYSVGATLYHMITGKAPQITFDPLELDMPNLRPGLDKIVERATQPGVCDRYPNAAEMTADLLAWQGSAVMLTPDPMPSGSPSTVVVPAPADSGSQWAWAMVAFLALGLGLVGGQVFRAPAATPTASPSTLAAVTSSPSPSPTIKASPAPKPPPKPQPVASNPPPKIKRPPVSRPSPAATHVPVPQPTTDTPKLGGPAYPSGHAPVVAHRPEHIKTPEPAHSTPTPEPPAPEKDGFVRLSSGPQHVSYGRTMPGYKTVADVFPGMSLIDSFSRKNGRPSTGPGEFVQFLNSESQFKDSWEFDESSGLTRHGFLPMRGSGVAGGYVFIESGSKQIIKIAIRPVPPFETIKAELKATMDFLASH